MSETWVVYNHCDVGTVGYCNINQPIQPNSEGFVIRTQEHSWNPRLEMQLSFSKALEPGPLKLPVSDPCPLCVCVSLPFSPSISDCLSVSLPPSVWASLYSSSCVYLSQAPLPPPYTYTHTHHYLVSFPNYQKRD